MEVLNGHSFYLALQIVHWNIGNPQSLGEPPTAIFQELGNCFLQSIIPLLCMFRDAPFKELCSAIRLWKCTCNPYVQNNIMYIGILLFCKASCPVNEQLISPLLSQSTSNRVGCVGIGKYLAT